jgi:hypothetical protein
MLASKKTLALRALRRASRRLLPVLARKKILARISMTRSHSELVVLRRHRQCGVVRFPGSALILAAGAGGCCKDVMTGDLNSGRIIAGMRVITLFAPCAA